MENTYAHFAGILAGSFTSDKRTNGVTFWKLTDSAPSWVGDAVYATHNGRMPDDDIYELCAVIACDIADYDDETGEYLHEIADRNVSCYHMERYRWLAAHLDNADYCEEAQEEGLVASDASISDRIAAGMYQQAYFIASTLHAAILAQVEEVNA